MNDFDGEYLRLTIRLHHAADQTVEKFERADRLIRKLADSGLLAEGVILGPVIHQRGYRPGAGGSDSAQFVQAVLHLPKGLGAVLLDMEEFLDQEHQPDGLEVAAMTKFEAIADCELAIKALFLPARPSADGQTKEATRIDVPWQGHSSDELPEWPKQRDQRITTVLGREHS
ncbi:MAG: hypothetical protein SNJ82_13505 [Gemmataceae bacterium]